MNSAVIIARVSTEEQKIANNSLPAQLYRLRKYCEIKDYKIIKEYSFDESAYKNERESFDKILEYIIKQDKKIAVCFDKVDRLSRNIFDKRVSLLYEKALKDEAELHFVSDNQIINSQLSAVEKFNFSISLGLAKYYSDAISDNVRRAQEQMLRKGIYPGKPPYGYKRVPMGKNRSEIVKDEFGSKIIQKAYELYATEAYSIDLLRQALKQEYGINWSKGRMDKVLKDHYYYGIMTWNNKTYPHRYPPILTKGLFERVQQIKAGFNKKPFKYAGKPYLYRGLLRCGHCGLSITPEEHKGHVYYHCTQYNGKHGAKWLTEEEITSQLGEVFKKIYVPKEILEKIVETLRTTHEAKVEFRKDEFDELSKTHELFMRRKEKLYMDRLDGRITENEYDKYFQEFNSQIVETSARLSMLQDAEDKYYITAKYLLELANRAHELFLRSEVIERRQLIKLVLSNLRIEGKTVCYEAQKPFDTLISYTYRQDWLPRLDSNQ